jgi:hypothetical protein
MKFSKIILSINLAAAIPLVAVAHSAAQAADKAISDKAQWLKDNLSQVQGLSATPGLLQSINNNFQNKSVTSANPAVRYRPFVPNRPLPSEKELSQTLLLQTARLAPPTSAPLSGTVSAFGSPAKPEYLNHRGNKILKPSTFAQALNTKYSQIADQIPARLATIDSAIKASKLIPSTISAIAAPSQIPKLAQPAQPSYSPDLAEHTQTSELIVPSESEALGASDMNMVNQYSQEQEVVPDNSMAQANSSAGPPPFPLNLLPEASLRQLMRGMAQAQRPAASQRNSLSGLRASPTRSRTLAYSSLPLGAFQSHLSGGTFMSSKRLHRPWRLSGAVGANIGRRSIARSSYPFSMASSIANTSLRLPIRHSSFLSSPILTTSRRVSPLFYTAVYPAYVSQARLF